MRKVAGAKITLFFDPAETGWTGQVSLESWFVKHLKENNLEATRIEIIGNVGEMMWAITQIKSEVPPYKLPHQSSIEKQFQKVGGK